MDMLVLIAINWAVLAVSLLALAVCLWAMSQKSPVPAASHPSLRQQYGDQMATVGETGSILPVQLALYSTLLAYAAAASLITGCSILVLPAYYVAGMAAFYGWHWAAHASTGALNDAHMQHHREDFPAHDFYGDFSGAIERDFPRLNGKAPTLFNLLDPRKSMTMVLAHEGPLAAAMACILTAGALFGTPVLVLAFVAVGYITMAMLGSALHISFHVRNFELEPYSWYRELRSLHYIHHLQRKNFAMVNMDVDKVAGSYLEVWPAHTESSESRWQHRRSLLFMQPGMQQGLSKLH